MGKVSCLKELHQDYNVFKFTLNSKNHNNDINNNNKNKNTKK